MIVSIILTLLNKSFYQYLSITLNKLEIIVSSITLLYVLFITFFLWSIFDTFEQKIDDVEKIIRLVSNDKHTLSIRFYAICQ